MAVHANSAQQSAGAGGYVHHRDLQHATLIGLSGLALSSEIEERFLRSGRDGKKRRSSGRNDQWELWLSAKSNSDRLDCTTPSCALSEDGLAGMASDDFTRFVAQADQVVPARGLASAGCRGYRVNRRRDGDGDAGWPWDIRSLAEKFARARQGN